MVAAEARIVATPSIRRTDAVFVETNHRATTASPEAATEPHNANNPIEPAFTVEWYRPPGG
jgi:hypothetical protein